MPFPSLFTFSPPSCMFLLRVGLLTYRWIIVIDRNEGAKESGGRAPTRLRYSFTIVPPFNPICRRDRSILPKARGIERAESLERHSIAVPEGWRGDSEASFLKYPPMNCLQTRTFLTLIFLVPFFFLLPMQFNGNSNRFSVASWEDVWKIPF